MKICNECGHKNSDGNNFCAKCGANLNEMNEPGSLVCKKCGTQNSAGDNFCINCGAELCTKKNSSNNHQRTKKNNSGQKKDIQKPLAYKGKKSSSFNSAPKTKTVWVAASIIIGVVIIVLSLNPAHKSQASQKDQSQIIENISNNPVVETEMRKIAEKFECSCGGCTKILTNCNCNTAITERNYIRSEIAQKKTEKQIILAVNNKYGHIISGGGFNKDLLQTN